MSSWNINILKDFYIYIIELAMVYKFHIRVLLQYIWTILVSVIWLIMLCGLLGPLKTVQPPFLLACVIQPLGAVTSLAATTNHYP